MWGRGQVYSSACRIPLVTAPLIESDVSVFCGHLSYWQIHCLVVQAKVHAWLFYLSFSDLVDSTFTIYVESNCVLPPSLLPLCSSNHRLCLDNCRRLLTSRPVSAIDISIVCSAHPSARERYAYNFKTDYSLAVFKLFGGFPPDPEWFQNCFYDP